MEVAVWAREKMNLQVLDLLLERGSCRQERRYDDHRAQVWRNAVAEFQGRQNRRPEPVRGTTVHEHYCDVRGRYQGKKRKDKERPHGSTIRSPVHGRGDNDCSYDRDYPEIAGNPDYIVQASDPSCRWNPKSNLPFEGPAALGDEPVTGIALANRCRVGIVLRMVPCALCAPKSEPRYFKFRAHRAARQLFDHSAIEVPAGEIHIGEIAAQAQRSIDKADALEQLRPIDGRYEAHARNDVADRHVVRALTLVLLPHDLVDRRALGCQALLQP